MRIIVSGDKLPYRLRIASDVTTTDYGPIVIAGQQFRLPLRSTDEVRDVYGSEVRNLMTFENCREFVGESVLKFSDTEPTPANK